VATLLIAFAVATRAFRGPAQKAKGTDPFVPGGTMTRELRFNTHKAHAFGALLPVLLLSTATLGTAEEPAATTGTGPRIALIDANKLFAQSKIGQSYAKKIDELNGKVQALQQEKEAGAAQRSAELATLREQAQKDVSRSAADRAAKAQQIRAKERDLQAFVEDGRTEIERLQQRVQQEAQSLRNEYRGKMRPHIEAVARQKGIDFLIDAAVTLQLSEAYDISKDVIVHADAAEQ
jgi:Skp family chaperone for outer membrane proteins